MATIAASPWQAPGKSHARRGLASVNTGWRRLRNRGVTYEGYQ